MADGEFRLRVGFTKAGRLRHLSHLEVTRSLERSVRRAALPYAVTRGFSPHMKVAFGPALPVGTAGLKEYWDIWLNEYVPATDALSALQKSMPQDIGPFAAGYVPASEPSLSAECRLGVYEIVLTGKGVTAQSVGTAIDAVIAEGELRVERKGKTKVYDLAEGLPKEPSIRLEGTAVVVEMTTRMSPQGSLRPDALVAEALSRSDIAAYEIAVTRSDLLFEEDAGARRPL